MSFRVLLLSAGLGACNVTAASTTGGADLSSRGDCPRGLAVVSSDFLSSEVALIDPRGGVKSSAFMSSASTVASNLAAPLSGDLEVASARTRPNELVLIDRQGTNVLTFVDARTAVVRAQLPVGTGFESNPQDYLELDEHTAVVPRLGENTEPGREPFDAGSDLLVLDPSVPAITGSVALPREPGFRPSPAGVTALGDAVLVTLQHVRPNFSGMSDGEVVAFAAENLELRYRLPLAGLQNCGRAESSPSARLLAVACTGFIDRKGNALRPESSGLVLLDTAHVPPREVQRFAAVDLIGGPLQASVEFVSESVLLVKSQTALGAAADNQLFALDLRRGAVELLATAARSEGAQGYGIALGGMNCQPECGDPCFVADASRGRLLRFEVDGDALRESEPVLMGGAGLPPTALAPFW